MRQTPGQIRGTLFGFNDRPIPPFLLGFADSTAYYDPGVLPLQPEAERRTMPDACWDQDNAEGLKAIAAGLRSDPTLDALVRFCELRERGLRPQALESLREFLAATSRWDEAVRRTVATRLVDLHLLSPGAHQFLAHPLVHGFIEPTLDAWREADPDARVPNRQLALLRSDPTLLHRSLRNDPCDDRVRARLVGLLIAEVDFATHHLSEGRFIGNEENAGSRLDEASRLMDEGKDADRFRALRREVAELRSLIEDWRQYRVFPEGDSFPEWCRKRGRGYAWWSIVYYRGDDGG